MSLQIWLPLNGSLENKGLMNIQANNIDSTIDSNGKIGSCYSFNGTTSRIYANDIDIETNDLSACFWFKIDEYKTSTYLTLFALATAAAAQHQIGAYLDKTTSKLIVTHNGSGLNTNFVPELNTWYHFAFTNLGTTSKCYINGEEIYSGTNAGTQRFSLCLCLCGRASSASGGGSGVTYPFMGAMNDFRLYDHCLSAKEVKEISKGLILHYKLDNKYIEPTTNLLPVSFSYPEISNANYYHEGSTNAAAPLGTSRLIAVTPGKYTYSCYIINNTSKNVRVTLRAFSSTAYNTKYALTSYITGNFVNSNSEGWSVVTYDFSDLETIKTVLVTFTSSGNVSSIGSDFQVQYAQLEAKDHQTPWALGGTSRNETTIYDSSGYEHNSNIKNELTISSDTPKYSCSTEADGTATPVDIPRMFDSTKLSNEFTLSTWVYNASDLRDANRYFYNGIIRMGFSTSYFVIINWFLCNEDLSYNAINSWAPVGEANSYTKDEWCHIALTFKDGVLKYYRNGSYITTVDRTNRGTFIKGQYNSNARLFNNWNGRLSDFRLYCTALSDDDIKELYNTSASIDNKNNLFTGELVEV